MRARGGVRRGFTRLSDRVGGAAAALFFGKSIQASQTVVVPKDGTYSIGAWGRGGFAVASNSGGSSGGFCSKTLELAAGASIAITINTTFTQVIGPGFNLVAYAAGDMNTPGTATGGDINLSGSVGVSAGVGLSGLGDNGGAGGPQETEGSVRAGGAGAPGAGPFQGGRGGRGQAGSTEASSVGQMPGAGAGENIGGPSTPGAALVTILGVGVP